MSETSCHRSADHCATGAKITGSRCCPTCAHDPRVALTEALRAAGLTDKPGEYDSDIHSWRCSHPDIYGPCSCFQDLVGDLEAVVAEIIAARLAPIRAVAEQWDTGCAREVLAALDAPQDAPRGPVGGEQGAEVAGGRSEGERGCECPPDWPCHSWAREPLVEVTDCHHMRTRTFETVPPHTKCLDCGAPVERRGWTWVCDGCTKTLTYSEVADWADGEHVLCETCNQPDGACFR